MFNRAARKIATPLALGGALALSAGASPFTGFGYSHADFQPVALGCKSSSSMSIAGSGMRRKNLYVMEVDVYMIQFYVDEDAMKFVSAWKKDGGNSSLADSLIKGNLGKSSPIAAVNCKFVRDVGKDKVVEAFNEAFKGCDSEAVAEFKSVTSSVIGDKMASGEDFTFAWYNDSRGLCVEKGGVVKSVPNTPAMKALENRLLNVYLDSQASVSPDLIKSMRD